MKDAVRCFGARAVSVNFMIPQNQAQQILGLPGQVNQLLVDLAPGPIRQG